jgi:hypothetical protein
MGGCAAMAQPHRRRALSAHLPPESATSAPHPGLHGRHSKIACHMLVRGNLLCCWRISDIARINLESMLQRSNLGLSAGVQQAVLERCSVNLIRIPRSLYAFHQT